MTIKDPCLEHAHNQWNKALQQGIASYEAHQLQEAVAALSEAIRISSSFHPLFHFLESGLNTELAQYLLAQHAWTEAESAFDRAIFLHHDNAIAIAGKQLAQSCKAVALPAYDTLGMSSPLRPSSRTDNGIHALRYAARNATDGDLALYRASIAQCEAAHLHYHQLAALPWLARATCFATMGEDALARNDIRHGMDLDRSNADLLELSIRITTQN
jgi:tetratricopeptide (TPR) repeat protein